MKKRKLIIDIGAAWGGFVGKLKKRNPTKEVIGIDHLNARGEVMKRQMGEYFASMSKADADRLHAVWMNHIDIKSMDAHREFAQVVKRLPPKTPIIMTVREESRYATIASAEAAGLKVIGERPFTKKMLGSEFTHKYYEESKGNSEKRPVRIVLMKK